MNSPHPDLIKITEIFLISNSFLVAALGTADTNPHRAAVSALGMLVSVLWWVCSHEAVCELRAAAVASTLPDASHATPATGGSPAESVAKTGGTLSAGSAQSPSRFVHSRRTRIMSWLAPIFASGWLISLMIHIALWNKPLGT